jgi:serine protease Do
LKETDVSKITNMTPNGKGGGIAIAFAILAIAGTAAVLGTNLLEASAAPKTQTNLTAVRLPAPAMPVQIADIVERVSPAVVTVHVSKSAESVDPRQQTPGFEEFFERFFDDDVLKRFGDDFRRQPHAQPGRPRSQGPRKVGLGSGFIIDAKGFIVTNNHVIDGADEISVSLKSGRKLEARVVGTDPKTDLALLKVSAAGDLPIVEWGASEDMRVGDWVITIGNPFGVGQTVTTGIISARHRNIGAGPFDDFLQIDAPINRGNSGGPAFNTEGRVVGVNTAIFSPSGGNVGIGFAIPSLMAKNIIADLRENGAVARGWLGVHIQEVTPELAESLDLDAPGGALVSRVSPNSPALRGGIERGDVILGVDRRPVKALRDLPRIIAAIKAGERVEMKILRGGRKMSLTMRIGAQPKAELASSPEAEDADVAGMKLAALDDDARRRLKLSKAEGGVLIAGVERASPAARLGLAPGDAILAVAGTPVNSASDVRRMIAAAKDGKRKSVLLLVAGRGGERFVALPMKRA